MSATIIPIDARTVRIPADFPSDEDLVGHLRHPSYRAGYLAASLQLARKDIAWAASALADGPSRRLLVDRLAAIDGALGLLQRAGT